MNRRAVTGLLCLLVLIGLVWGVASTEWWKTRREFAAIAAEVATAPKLVLFEGLPHKRVDSDRFRSEVHAKPTIKIQKYFFYGKRHAECR